MFELSDLTLPIIQAPMAGGISSPGLASAVSNFGGVGSFGFAYSTPEEINSTLNITRKLTKGPINTNFFVFDSVNLPPMVSQTEALNAIKSLPIAKNLIIDLPDKPYLPDLELQLEPLWLHKPQILTFHMGIPPRDVIDRAKGLGILVGVTATSLYEAGLIEKAGAGFIIAQGIEAGGHRGKFSDNLPDEEASLAHLVEGLSEHVKIPVVASGGLMSGEDVGKMLECGAAAAQMGTAFLCCDEAGTSATYRRFLLNEKDRQTRLTTSFSGRRARGISNLFMELMENKITLPFPVQNTITADIRKRAESIGDGEYLSLWAGTSFEKIRALSAIELMQEIEKELKSFTEKVVL